MHRATSLRVTCQVVRAIELNEAVVCHRGYEPLGVMFHGSSHLVDDVYSLPRSYEHSGAMYVLCHRAYEPTDSWDEGSF